MYKVIAKTVVFERGTEVYRAADAVHKAWLAGYRAENGDTPRLKPLPGCNKFASKQEAKVKISEIFEIDGNKKNPLIVKEDKGVFQVVQNIAVEPEFIHPLLHYTLSGKAAEKYVEMIQKNPERFNTDEGVKEVLKEVHDIWKELNGWEVAVLKVQIQDKKKKFQALARYALFQRDFADLPATEQVKDINVIVPILETAFPEIDLKKLNQFKQTLVVQE